MDGGIGFLKSKFFQKKKAINAKQFVELHTHEDGKAYIDNPTLTAEVNVKKIYRPLYFINGAKEIPAGYKVGEPFDIIYDAEEVELIIVPHNDGFIRTVVDGACVEISTSEMVPSSRKQIYGRIPLRLGEIW